MEDDAFVNRHVKLHFGLPGARTCHDVIKIGVASLYFFQGRLEQTIGLKRQNPIIFVEIPKRERRDSVISADIDKQTIRPERDEVTQRIIALVVWQQKRK